MMPDCEPLNPKPMSPRDASEVGAGAPDPSKCQAGRAAHGVDLPLCFVKPFPDCQFGLRFAGNHFCRHPEVERIIARTRPRQ
jgi:hypothetical protein